MAKPFLYVLIFLSPLQVFAESTIDCHCFQERVFNPQRTFAADRYFLATAQNSFMALVYNLDKKQLVKAKMSGQSADQLWIGNDLAARSRHSVTEIARVYQQSGSWQKVVSQLSIDPEALGPKYLGQLGHPEELSNTIADHQLVTRLGISPERLQKARLAGMTTQQLILASLLNPDPLQEFDALKKSSHSWGEKLFKVGLLDGQAIYQRIEEILGG